MQKRMAPQNESAARLATRNGSSQTDTRQRRQSDLNVCRSQIDDAIVRMALHRASSIVFNSESWPMERELVKPR